MIAPWRARLATASLSRAAACVGLLAYGGMAAVAPIAGGPAVGNVAPAPVASPADSEPGSAPVAAVDVDLGAQALSILGAHCLPCHGPRDGRGGKGGLRVDSRGGVLAGGDGGAVIVSGSPDRGELFARVRLPAEHDDAMPPKGDRLSDEDMAALNAWIAAWCPEPAPVDARKVDEAARTSLLRRLATNAPVIRDRDIEAARAAGAHIASALPGTALLEARFIVDRVRVTGEAIATLAALRDVLVVADLSGTAIEDAGLQVLSGAPRLMRLDLGSTAIGDGGVRRLGKLPELRSLVLFGTAITDGTLEHLASKDTAPQLTDLYVAATRVSPRGLAAFSKARPDVVVRSASLLDRVPPEAPAEDEPGARQRKRR